MQEINEGFSSLMFGHYVTFINGTNGFWEILESVATKNCFGKTYKILCTLYQTEVIPRQKLSYIIDNMTYQKVCALVKIPDWGNRWVNWVNNLMFVNMENKCVLTSDWNYSLWPDLIPLLQQV